MATSYTYGLICIPEKLKEHDKTLAFQTMTRKRFNELNEQHDNGESVAVAQDVLEKRILHNLQLTKTILENCAANDIYHYRLSSKLFPLVTDTTLNLSIKKFTNYRILLFELKQIGKIAKKHGVSISIQLDHYNILASKRPDIVSKAVGELNFHAHMMDLMGLPQDYSAPMSIRPNTSTNEQTEKNMREIVNRFYEGFNQCDEGVQKRLVIKNEDKGCWNCAHLFMYFYNYCGTQHAHFFPLAYDNSHDRCNPANFQGKTVTQQQNVDAFTGTWNKNVPIFHWDSVETIPDFGTEITWEIESQRKDFAIAASNSKKKAAPKPQAAPSPKKQESPEVLKKLEANDKQDAVYTAYNHVYGVNM
jgi:UV DNA damage repair endonuclease